MVSRSFLFFALLFSACGPAAPAPAPTGTRSTAEPEGFYSAPTSQSLSAPSALQITNTAATSVSLKWTVTSPKTVQCHVWRGDADFSKWVLLATVPASAGAYVDRTVQSGATYTYGIRAEDASGNISAGSNVVVAVVPDAGVPAEEKGTFERPFPKARWLYEPVPAQVQLDPDEAAMKQNLLDGKHALALDEFGIPFYRASASTPRKVVDCIETTWGECTLEKYGPRPLSVEMVPHAGSDGAMVVIDESPKSATGVGRTTDEYWQYAWNNGVPRTQWGGVGDLDGDGVNAQSTGSGVSRAAGIVRVAEIAAGKIEHALVFATAYCKTKSHRPPATKDDGKYDGLGGVPEGVRVQLDPSLNPDSYGLNAAEKTIFVALQKYGAYNIDCTAPGVAMTFPFEKPTGGPSTVYADNGLAYDYYELSKIPWEKLRILKSWNGQ